jgi:hypothetical protein
MYQFVSLNKFKKFVKFNTSWTYKKQSFYFILFNQPEFKVLKKNGDLMSLMTLSFYSNIYKKTYLSFICIEISEDKLF